MRASVPAAGVTLEELDRDPYPHLARLRAEAPVAWVPALGGWLVTRYDLALAVMRDADTFTVEDDRFSTAQVVGPSMLSLDGPAHARHRAPFTPPLRSGPVRAELGGAVDDECMRLIDRLEPTGRCDLRADFAGPLAAGVMTRVLGLPPEEAPAVRRWYGEIVAAVTALTAGEPLPERGRRAFAELGSRLRESITSDGRGSVLVAAATGDAALPGDAVVANAAVLLFGGVDTTEGMLTNAALHLLGTPGALAAVRGASGRAGAWHQPGAGHQPGARHQSRAGHQPGAEHGSDARSPAPDRLDALIEESLRLEPAAAVLDRYATRGVTLAGAEIAAGDLVRVSLTAAGRDPAVFADPDRLDLDRPRPRRHLAFAQGPHVCIGVHLARLEARTALTRLLERLPGLRLDPAHRPEVRGLVFRKPPELRVLWG